MANNYDLAANEIIADWEKKFGAKLPHRGAEISDYIDGVYKDADLKEN